MLSEQEKKEICGEYSNSNIRALCRKYKRGFKSIKSVLVENNIQLKSRSNITKTFCSPRSTNDKIDGEILDLFQQGFGDRKIARTVGVSRAIVKRVLGSREKKSFDVHSNKEIEIWKEITSYEGFYEVSNRGRVRSLDRNINNGKVIGRTLRPTKSYDGYLNVSLSKNGIKKRHRTHRLVAFAYIPNPNGLNQINHKDGNKINDCVSNLEWINQSNNQKHALQLGIWCPAKGSKHGLAKLNEEQVLEIRRLRSSGYTLRELSKEFHVCDSTICMITKRLRWKHI